MAHAMRFGNNPIIEQEIRFKTAAKQSLQIVPGKRPSKYQQEDIKKLPQMIYKERNVGRCSSISSVSGIARKLLAVASNNSNINTSPVSPAQTLVLFYSAINEKKLKQLDKLIADDCFFEDYSFPTPFQGKKETMYFLTQLTSCMGVNMKFNVDHICEGNDHTAGVNWHLDWNKIQVPFTRGSSFYSLSVDGDKLVIKKARVLIESPIKLGTVALTIFRFMTSLFDAFPVATESFLKRPHVIFQILLKTYKVAIKPVIGPFLVWYIKLLNFAACILSLSLRILYYLSKIFHM